MGDNSMRTKEQVKACLELVEEEEKAIPKGTDGYSPAYLQAHFRFRAIIRVLKWVLREN